MKTVAPLRCHPTSPGPLFIVILIIIIITIVNAVFLSLLISSILSYFEGGFGDLACFYLLDGVQGATLAINHIDSISDRSYQLFFWPLDVVTCL